MNKTITYVLTAIGLFFSGSGIATTIPTHGLNKYCRDVVVRTVGKIYENRALIQCYFKDVPFLARV